MNNNSRSLINVQDEQIVFRCSRDMKQTLKYLADCKGIKLSDLIRNVCVGEMKKDNKGL